MTCTISLLQAVLLQVIYFCCTKIQKYSGLARDISNLSNNTLLMAKKLLFNKPNIILVIPNDELVQLH